MVLHLLIIALLKFATAPLHEITLFFLDIRWNAPSSPDSPHGSICTRPHFTKCSLLLNNYSRNYFWPLTMPKIQCPHCGPLVHHLPKYQWRPDDIVAPSSSSPSRALDVPPTTHTHAPPSVHRNTMFSEQWALFHARLRGPTLRHQSPSTCLRVFLYTALMPTMVRFPFVPFVCGSPVGFHSELVHDVSGVLCSTT